MTRCVGCLLVCILLVGCDSSGTANKGSSNGTTIKLPEVKREKAPAAGSTVAAKKKAPVPEYVVDNLLAGKDLSSKLRYELRLHKANVGQKITEEQYDLMRSQHDVLYVVTLKRKESWKPTNPEKVVKKVSEPVPLKLPTTSRDRIKTSVEFYRIGLDHFKSREIPGLDDAAHEQAVAILEELYADRSDEKEDPDWASIRKRLVALCKENEALYADPLYQYSVGLLSTRIRNMTAADGSYRRSVENLQQSDYPARFAVIARKAYLNSQRFQTLVKNPAQRLADYYLTLFFWLENDLRATGNEHRIVYGLVKDFIVGCKKNGEFGLLRDFRASFKKIKDLPPWLNAMVQGSLDDQLGWAWRGNGWAANVSEQNFKLFEQYQEMAAEHFREAYKLNPGFPEAASELIGISNTGYEKEGIDYWFEKAIAAQTDYMNAYYAMLLAKLPQWGGSAEEMMEFAATQAGKEQFDTLVPAVMIDIHSVGADYMKAEAREKFNDPKFARKAIDALTGMMTAGERHILNGSFQGPDYYLTLNGIIASRAKLYELARENFEQLEGRRSEDAIDAVRAINFDLVRSKAYALTGDRAEDCRKMIALENEAKGELDSDTKSEIVGKCEGILAALGDDDEAAIWLNYVRDKFRFESEFELGMNAALTFDKGLSLWDADDRSHFEFESDDSVVIDNTKSIERVSLINQLQTGTGPKIFEYAIEFLDSNATSQELTYFTPSVSVMNYRNAFFAFGLNAVSFRKSSVPSHVKRMAQFSFGYRDATRKNSLYVYYTPISPGANQVELRVAPSYFEVYINDRFLCRSASKEIKGTTNRFELCHPMSRNGRGRARISGIRIENWMDPPPIGKGAAAVLDYYRTLAAEDPGDKWTAFWFAHALHQNGEFEEAKAQYEVSIDAGMPEPDVAFYLGDCHDQLGETAEALDWYFIAAAAENEEVVRVFKKYSNPCHWAAFRLACHMYFSPSEELRERISKGQFCRVAVPSRADWAVTLGKAMEAAGKGEFDSAVKLFDRKFFGSSSSSELECIKRMTDTWKSGRQFVIEDGSRPIYLDFDETIPFFRCFEDELDSAWKGVY